MENQNFKTSAQRQTGKGMNLFAVKFPTINQGEQSKSFDYGIEKRCVYVRREFSVN